MAHSSYLIRQNKTENRPRGIPSWPIVERPRERLLEKGAEALSLGELLAILIGTGLKNLTAVDLAKNITALPGELSQKSIGELVQVAGLGPVKAARIVAAFELGRRGQLKGRKGTRLVSAEAVVTLLRPRFHGATTEMFLAVSVDVKNRPLAIHEIARGSGEGVSFQPREVFSEAIKIGASGIIVAHNHPSGDPTPSLEDEQLTARVREGAQLLGLRFLDHVVVGEENYFSFATQRTE